MKKAFGIIFIVLAALLTPFTAVALFLVSKRIFELITNASGEKVTEMFGSIFFAAIIGFITFTLYRLGYKWIKGKPKSDTNPTNEPL